MKRRSDIGFTFIELLIALTIFSIIATSIYYTLSAGIGMYRRENSIMKNNQRIRIFFDVVASDLRNSVIYSGIVSEWGADKILFPTLINIYDNGRLDTDLVKVVYYYNSIDGKLTKYLATIKEGFNEIYGEERILLDNLEALTFLYCYEVPAGEGEYEWREEWEFKDKIPRGIKIRFTLKDGTIDTVDTFENIIFIPIGEIGKEG